MLPFSRAQFLEVFANYNLAVWPVQIVAYALGLSMVLMLLRPARTTRLLIGTGLAVMWSWTGIAYHWLHFSAINAAALVFGGLFLLQGALFSHAAAHDRLRFGSPGGVSALVGWALVLYAAIAYPLAGMWAGHRYPQLPMFGITPCPVTLFTFGLLLLTTGPVQRGLLVIPFIWSLVGASAALLLGMPQDWPLLFSGVAIPILLFRDRGRIPVNAA
jgi:hypothetical protein